MKIKCIIAQDMDAVFEGMFGPEKRLNLTKKSINILVVKDFDTSVKMLKHYLPLAHIVPIKYVGYMLKISDEVCVV